VKSRIGPAALLALLPACGTRPANEVEAVNEFASAPPDRGLVAPPAANMTAPGPPATLPDDRPAAGEGIADPRGRQGAETLLHSFGELLEQRRFAEARLLWSDEGRASGLTTAEFAAAYEKYAVIRSEVGAAGEPEGAAGSVFIEIPMRLHGTLKTGEPFDLAGPVTLRRVNDIPGSTVQQREWHIARTELRPRP
jgi:hypothetical protein